MKCQTCNAPLEGKPRVRLEWQGFQTLRMNGIAMWACQDHVRLIWPEREIELPDLPSHPHADEFCIDPAHDAESQLVTVYQSEGDWLANCLDHGAVALKAERDDAELGAARHLARMHVEFVA